MAMSGEQLKFPLVWHGRLVVHAGTAGVEDSVMRIFQSLGVSEGMVSYSNKSTKGTYETWSLSGTVHDLASLRALFVALESLPGVRMLF